MITRSRSSTSLPSGSRFIGRELERWSRRLRCPRESLGRPALFGICSWWLATQSIHLHRWWPCTWRTLAESAVDASDSTCLNMTPIEVCFWQGGVKSCCLRFCACLLTILNCVVEDSNLSFSSGLLSLDLLLKSPLYYVWIPAVLGPASITHFTAAGRWTHHAKWGGGSTRCSGGMGQFPSTVARRICPCQEKEARFDWWAICTHLHNLLPKLVPKSFGIWSQYLKYWKTWDDVKRYGKGEGQINLPMTCPFWKERERNANN